MVRTASASAQQDTRTLLLRAAAHLFARHGIDAVRIHDINSLAGQRNESSIHYYFGGRWQLVEAILEENDLAAGEVLDRPPSGSVTPKQMANHLVQRLAIGLATPEGRDWLRIVFQLMTRYPNQALPDERPAAVAKHLKHSLSKLSDDLLWSRTIAMLQFMTLQMAERARLIDDEQGGKRNAAADDAFLEDL